MYQIKLIIIVFLFAKLFLFFKLSKKRYVSAKIGRINLEYPLYGITSPHGLVMVIGESSGLGTDRTASREFLHNIYCYFSLTTNHKQAGLS